MSGDTDNPRIWAGADVFVAPVGTDGPTDVATPLDADFEALGLLSEDGMVESRDQTIDDKYAWGGILYRTVRSKQKRTFKVTALEDNPVVFGLVEPGSSAESTGGTTTRTVVVPQANKQSFVFELLDGDIIKRRHIPTGEVTEVGDVTYSDSETSMYELTITVYPDADGVLFYDITDDPQAEETGS